MKLSSDAKLLIRLLIDSGFKAYAVGGCVRDSIIGRPVGDVDITTSAKPSETEAILKAHQIRYIETGLKHGTITALLHSVPYEITTFRSDGDYQDNRHPDSVTFVSDLTQDLARRDFTMNALAYNDEEGVIDAFGGEEDIKNKIIRTVGEADKRFTEDALRMMRALRFSSVLGFTIEENTKRSILKNKELLKTISAERIFIELKKLLLGDGCEQVLLEYREVMAVIIPELAVCFDFPQNSKWHIYDVYTHIVKSVALAPKKDYLRMALLLHDIGKPYCKTTDENRQDHFKGHPAKSVEISEEILKRLKVSNEFKHKVIKLVQYHDLHITRKPSNIKKWLRLLGEELTFDFIDLKIADMLTHNLDLAGEEVRELRNIRQLTAGIIDSGEPYRISDLKINGKDLMGLGYRGAAIQEELENLIKIVSGNASCNSKEKLLAQAEKDLGEYSGD